MCPRVEARFPPLRPCPRLVRDFRFLRLRAGTGNECNEFEVTFWRTLRIVEWMEWKRGGGVRSWVLGSEVKGRDVNEGWYGSVGLYATEGGRLVRVSAIVVVVVIVAGCATANYHRHR